MKIPGMGEVKNKTVYIGAAVVGGIVMLAYYRKKKAVPVTNSDGSTTTVDPNAIDPNTGMSYASEGVGAVGGSGGYYGSSVPNPYVNQSGTAGTTGTVYTSNFQWESDALTDLQNLFGVSYNVAVSALGKYIAQTPGGLNDSEYQAISEVVGLLGPPPNGTFRLIQAPPVVTTPTPTPTPTPEPAPTPEPTPTPTPAPQPAPVFNPPPPTPIASPPPYVDPNLHTTATGTYSLNDLARWNNSSAQRIIDATRPSEPSDVQNYLNKAHGNYNTLLPAGTRWNIPHN